MRMVLKGKHRQAVATLLAFDAFLRVGELLNIRREDVSVPGDARVDAGYDKIGIRLRRTKTGDEQFVTVHSPQISALLLDIVRDTRRRSRLFPWSASSFRGHFKRSCAALGLSARYVPHSLRHGGATYWFAVLDKPITDVMQRGRWAVQRSASHYIQMGSALALSVDVPAAVAELGKRISADLLLYFYAAAHQHDAKVNPFHRARV
jgi:integrase